MYRILRQHVTYFARFVVSVTVGEHSVEVRNALLCRAIVSRLQTLLYCTHVHRMFDDLVIILQNKNVLSGSHV